MDEKLNRAIAQGDLMARSIELERALSAARAAANALSANVSELRRERRDLQHLYDRSQDRVVELEKAVADLQVVCQRWLGVITCESLRRILDHPTDCARCAQIARDRAEAERS